MAVTSSTRGRASALLLSASAVVLALAVLSIVSSGSDVARIGAVPPDLAKTGRVATPIQPAGYLDEDRALAAARSAAPDLDLAGGTLDAYLVSVSDLNAAATGVGLLDRPVWLFRYSGLQLEFADPSARPGQTSQTRVIRVGYVLVDAVTSEVLDIQYWQ
jgi:hypothetical protein